MLNQCNFIGRLGSDAEVRYSQSGAAVANLNMACTESWTKDGKKEEKTEWVRVVAFSRLAEIMGEYLSKGSLVYISGKMQTRQWDDKDGNKRYTTEIVAREMKMLGGKGEKQTESPSQDNSMGDDVPF